MQLLTDWISNIILLILVASVLELLLPNSSLQRYVKMVVGLLMLVIILTPLFSIFGNDVDSWIASINNSEEPLFNEQDLQISIETKKNEIQQGQLAYISEQVAVQLKRQVEEELIAKYDQEVVAVNVTLTNFLEEEDYMDSIAKVSILLREKREAAEAETETIPAIALVTIDTSERVEPLRTDHAAKNKEILHYLATAWLLPIEKIDVSVEGGSFR